MQLDYRYGRIRTNIEPNLDFFLHCRKECRGSECDQGILATKLYGDMWNGGFWYVDKGG